MQNTVAEHPILLDAEYENDCVHFDCNLPERLSDTDNHLNCPNERVPIVNVTRNGKFRPMVFLGVVTSVPSPGTEQELNLVEIGDIICARPLTYGHDNCPVYFKENEVEPFFRKKA